SSHGYLTFVLFSPLLRRPPMLTLFPYTTLFRSLYIGYVIVLAKWNPRLMPPLPQSERRVELPSFAQALAPLGSNALTGLWRALRSEEHTSELQSRFDLVCRLLLEKKNKKNRRSE